MKKTLLLLCALLAGVSGAWADTYTAKLVDGTNNPKGTLNTVSGASMTSTATAGFAGVVTSNVATIDQGTWNSTRYMVIKPSAGQTANKVTITAPDGYLITGFSMNCCNYSSSSPYYVSTKDDFSTETATPLTTYSGSTTISVTDLESSSTSFWFYCNAASMNWMMVSSFTVYLEDDPSANLVDVTYRVYDPNDNLLFTSDAVGTPLGANITELPAEYKRDYYTYSTVDVPVENTTTNIDFTATWNGPFDFSTDFENATWYYAFERSTTQLYYSESGITTGTNASADGEKWAFMGNPYQGIQVINKAAGEGNYLTHSAATLSWSETATNWTLMKHPSANNSTGKGFVLYDVVDGKTYSIYLGSDGAVTALNATITSGNDNNKGGCIDLTPVPTDYSDMVAANITPYFSVLDAYYGLTSADAATLKSTYPYWNGETACTEAQYKTLLDAVMAAITLPESGKYYRIKNYDSNRYLGNETGTVAAFDNGTAASTVVYMTQNEGTTTWTLQGSAAYTGLTVSLGAPGLFTASTAAGTYNYLRDNNGAISKWSAVSTTDDPEAYWSIVDAEDITVAISAAKFATLYLPFAVTIPADVKAYTVSGLDGNVLTLSEVSTTIPAGTPVILEGKAGPYQFEISYSTAESIENELTGTNTKTAAPNGSYILQNQDGKFGFYQVDTTVATPNIPANRAYIPASENAVKAFFFGNITDGIEFLSAAEAAGEIYNLAGQRISKLQRGVNIVNGKKVIVK